ncbi:MAG: hypothetical protein NZ700_00305, partial [Gemmataceae bacterium]|nr:hypothetical protein [Gemmataceae bacterium]MDW8266930.1 hypothetical protein [Gemmataceae bacterium]
GLGGLGAGLRPWAAAAALELTLAQTEAKASGVRVALSAARGAEAVTCSVFHHGKPLHDAKALAESLPWVPQPSNSLTFHPRAYALHDIRPGWPEDFRARIEHDMAALPGLSDKWLNLRVELRDGEVRVWLEDRLVAIKKSPDVRSAGRVRLQLGPGVQLASCTAVPWRPTPGFVPVPLEGYANGRGLVGNVPLAADVLPPPTLAADGTRVWPTVQGIPFAFPSVNLEGKDHLDISRSLFRQATMDGYSGLQAMGPRWFGAAHRDPARIQLRIPNGQYDRLYVIAAAEERKDALPILTAVFYRPQAGFPEAFTTTVPSVSATVSDAQPLMGRLANGQPARLWLVTIPLDPGRLSAFADLDVIELELTKKLHLYRSYPDPILYSLHQGGLPSSVHVYAVTLGEVPVGFRWEPERFGHVWVAPAVPRYIATLTNHTADSVDGELLVRSRSYDGSDTTEQRRPVRLQPGQTLAVTFEVPVKLNGYHDITATWSALGRTWTEQRSFVRLAPDRRAERWREGQGRCSATGVIMGAITPPRRSTTSS